MSSILDAFPFPFSDPTARELRKRLADLYPSSAQARRILADIGADTTLIFFEQAPFDLWHEILRQQGDVGMVRPLVARVDGMLPATSPAKTFFRDLLSGESPKLAPEPRAPDGAPVFISGDDSAPKPEALLYRDSLMLSIGRVPALIATLQRLVALSPAVCRLEVQMAAGATYGTAFRVGPNLLLTNWHVLHDVSGARARVVTAEFGYETDAADHVLAATPIKCDAESIVANKADDWAVIRTAEAMPETSPIVGLRDGAAPKPYTDAFIVQHPEGGRKRLGFVRNQVTEVTERVVHYCTDTMEGSSGSPVFDGSGRLIALHHAGGRPQEVLGGPPIKMNEGIRVDRVLAGLTSAGVAIP